jgi:uncharacterized protein
MSDLVSGSAALFGRAVLSLVVQAFDAFRANRGQYEITDALIRFHHAIVHPNWSRLELYRPQRAQRFWTQLQETFSSQVMGPAFEEMCRVWTQEYAAPETLGGEPDTVASGVLNNPAGKSQYQLDIVVRDEHEEVLAVGEVKWGETVGTRHLTWLREAVGLFRAQRRKGGTYSRPKPPTDLASLA